MTQRRVRLSAQQRAAVLRRQAEQEGTGMSTPMRAVVQLRLTPEERQALHAMAEECNVTLSWAMREGARLYLQELGAGRLPAPERTRAAT